MNIHEKVINEIFTNRKFAETLAVNQNGGDLLNDTIPASWGADETRYEMKDFEDVYLDQLKTDSNFYWVSLTYLGDTEFDFWGVNRVYKDLFLWTLNFLDIKYTKLEYFDPYNFEDYSETHQED